MGGARSVEPIDRPPAWTARERTAERVAAAAYGSVNVLAALSVLGISDVARGNSSELVLGVGLATWIAHLFSEILAEHVRHHEQAVLRDEVGRAAVDGLPILASTLLPAAALFLGRIDVVGDDSAKVIAVCIAVLQLALLGRIVARIAPVSPGPAWTYAILTTGVGIGVVALILALGH